MYNYYVPGIPRYQVPGTGTGTGTDPLFYEYGVDLLMQYLYILGVVRSTLYNHVPLTTRADKRL